MTPPKPRRPFGSIYRRGVVWEFCFRRSGHRVRRGGYPTRGAAEVALQSCYREFERHQFLGVRPLAAMTVSSFWVVLRRRLARQRAASTAAMDEIRWSGIFEPTWGSRVLKEITREEVHAWITDRHQGRALGPAGRVLRPVSRATLNRDLAFLSVIFRAAARADLMLENPAAGIERAKEQERAGLYLSPEDINRVVATARAGGAGAVLGPYVRLLADTGLRRGELERLEWVDVDEARGVLVVRRSKNYTTRTVPLTLAGQDAISSLKLLRDAKDPAVIPLAREGLTPAMVRGRFKLAVRAAALPPTLRIHDLRHVFGAQMSAAGVPIAHIQRIMGHQSITTTLRYAKHQPDDASRLAIDRLENLHRPKRDHHDSGASERAGGPQIGPQAERGDRN